MTHLPKYNTKMDCWQPCVYMYEKKKLNVKPLEPRVDLLGTGVLPATDPEVLPEILRLDMDRSSLPASLPDCDTVLLVAPPAVVFAAVVFPSSAS